MPQKGAIGHLRLVTTPGVCRSRAGLDAPVADAIAEKHGQSPPASAVHILDQLPKNNVPPRSCGADQAGLLDQPWRHVVARQPGSARCDPRSHPYLNPTLPRDAHETTPTTIYQVRSPARCVMGPPDRPEQMNAQWQAASGADESVGHHRCGPVVKVAVVRVPRPGVFGGW